MTLAFEMQQEIDRLRAQLAAVTPAPASVVEADRVPYEPWAARVTDLTRENLALTNERDTLRRELEVERSRRERVEKDNGEALTNVLRLEREFADHRRELVNVRGAVKEWERVNEDQCAQIDKLRADLAERTKERDAHLAQRALDNEAYSKSLATAQARAEKASSLMRTLLHPHSGACCRCKPGGGVVITEDTCCCAVAHKAARVFLGEWSTEPAVSDGPALSEKADWHSVTDDTAFARPFGTVRQCTECGALVGGGPNRCVRCVRELEKAVASEKPGLTARDFAEISAELRQESVCGHNCLLDAGHDGPHDPGPPVDEPQAKAASGEWKGLASECCRLWEVFRWGGDDARADLIRNALTRAHEAGERKAYEAVLADLDTDGPSQREAYERQVAQRIRRLATDAAAKAGGG